MKNLNEYNVKNIKNIKDVNGGCFAFDAGWLIRSAFKGNTPGAVASSIIEYATHYANASECAA